MDWSVRNRDLVAHHIIENAKSGDIVLLHDPYDTSVEAALQAIEVLQAQGYEFVTLEELFSLRRRHAAGRTLLSARG